MLTPHINDKNRDSEMLRKKENPETFGATKIEQPGGGATAEQLTKAREEETNAEAAKAAKAK